LHLLKIYLRKKNRNACDAQIVSIEQAISEVGFVKKIISRKRKMGFGEYTIPLYAETRKLS